MGIPSDGVDLAIDLFREKFPNLDSDAAAYVESVLTENAQHFESEGDVHDAISDLITGFVDNVDQQVINQLCSDIYDHMKLDGQNSEQNVTLDAPVHMANLLDNFNTRLVDNQSIWMAKKELNSQVDSRKLEKAEAKIREKQAKRTTFAKFVSSTIGQSNGESKESEGDFATVSQQIDRRDVATSIDASGRHVGDVKLENFDISFGSRVLLREANLTVAYGRRYGFVGRNGYGKTTLLRALARRDLRLPSCMQVLHIEQEVVGDSTTALDSVLKADTERASCLAELASLQKEEASSSVVVDSDDADNNQGNDSTSIQSARRIQQLYARLHAIEADKAPAQASVILHGLGFTPEMQKRATKEFSGGWRMRIALAQALFAQPDLLLLDEPTNMLDMRALMWLEGYLQTSNNIMIIVSHDRAFLNAVATDIIHLTSSHRLDAYRGNYDAFELARADRLLAQQREYEAQKLERDHLQQFIDKFRYNAKRASLVQSRIKQLERMPPLVAPDKESKVVIKLPECDKISSPVIQLDEVDFAYASNRNRLVLSRVNLSVGNDSRICIVGENGAGKTTLLRLLLGHFEPSKGLRHVNRGLRLGYFSQHHVDQLDLALNSLEFLARQLPGQSEQFYRSQLAAFAITDMLALQPIGTLSGGQKSRVAFAVMCAAKPNVLILDEPTNHLDVETIAALAEALSNFNGGVVLVSHDERLIESVCTELWVCTRFDSQKQLVQPTSITQSTEEEKDSTGGSRVFSISGGLAEYKKAVQADLESTS